MISAEKAYKKHTVLLILVMTFLRLAIAFILDLGNDEAYYWLYSQKLEWNYFDHPPIVALWTKIFTLNLWMQSEVALRLGSVVGCAIATWLMFKTVSKLYNKRAGFFAAFLYNCSVYASVTAGIYLMPDAPQMVFWTLSLYAIACITKDERSWGAWLLLGIASGLCIMSKVHGGFIWIGIGLFVLFQKRTWLRLPQLYIAALLCLLTISPILIWNIQNDFVTYRFHSERVVIRNEPFTLMSFPRQMVHQLLWNNPVNVILICIGIAAFFRRRIERLSALSVYLFIGIPFAAFLLFVSLFRDTVLIHWSGPAYITLIPLAAIRLASFNLRLFPSILKLNAGLLAAAFPLWIALVKFYPGNMGKQSSEQLGKGDITLDIFGWKEAGEKFKVFYAAEKASGRASAETPLVCTYWWGAHVEYYFARPAETTMLGLGEIAQVHHYRWMNAYRVSVSNPETAYCVMPSDDDYALPTDYYRQIELATVITINRSGKPAHHFRVYRLKGLKKGISVTL